MTLKNIIKKPRLGETAISKMYLGNTVVYQYVPMIIYKSPFQTTKDSSGNMVLLNKDTDNPINYDAKLYTGRALELGATNGLPIPIHHTLGADSKQVATLGTGWTDNGIHSYTGATASSSLSNLSTVTSAPSVLIEFTITEYTSGTVGGKGALGTYTIESTTESLTGDSFVGTLTINSVKQITNPNSYMTYFDVVNNTFVQTDMSTLTPSQYYTVISKTINNVLVHTTPLTTEHLTTLNANPNLMAKLALSPTGTIPELSGFTFGASDGYYCGSEGKGQYVINSRNTESTNLLTYSSVIEDAVWRNVQGVSIVTTNDTTAPDSTLTADKIVPEATTLVHGKRRLVTFVKDTVYTYSVYAKLHTVGVHLEIWSYPSSSAIFNLSTGTIIASPNSIALVEKVGNGWYRCSITWTSSVSTDNNIDLRLTRESNSDKQFIGNGIDGIYLWGGQFEDNPKPTVLSNTTTSIVDGQNIKFGTISNYAETIRTNVDLNPKGIQTTCLTLDGAGVPTAYVDNALEWHGNGYADTSTVTDTVKITTTVTPYANGSIAKSGDILSIDTVAMTLGVPNTVETISKLSVSVIVSNLLNGSMSDFKMEKYTAMTIYDIGFAGDLGFGVGAVPDGAMPTGWTKLAGHDDVSSANYGNVTDTTGSVMVCIPKFYYRYSFDNIPMVSHIPLQGYVLNRAFINNGVELDRIFVDKYEGSNVGGILKSVQGVDPSSTNSAHNPISALSTAPANNYGGCYKAVKSRSSKHIVTPSYVKAMLAMLARIAGKAVTNCAYATVVPYYPKGNNNNALKDHADSTVTFTGSGYSNCALTGSGVPFAKTTHNGQECGIADLNGNMFEVVSGLTYMARTGATGTTNTTAIALTAHGYAAGTKVAFGGTPSDGSTYDTVVYTVATVVDANNFTIDVALARDILATDGIYTGKTFYMLKESVDITAILDDSETAGTGAWDMSLYDQVDISALIASNIGSIKLGNAANQVFEMSTDRNSDAYKRSSLGMPTVLGSSAGGTTEFGNDEIYRYFRHKCVPFSGGFWSSTSDAGLGYVYLSAVRTYSDANVGVRCSYIN